MELYFQSFVDLHGVFRDSFTFTKKYLVNACVDTIIHVIPKVLCFAFLAARIYYLLKTSRKM